MTTVLAAKGIFLPKVGCSSPGAKLCWERGKRCFYNARTHLLQQIWDGSGLERQHGRYMNGMGLDWVQQQRQHEAEHYAEPSESSEDDAEDDDVRALSHCPCQP